LAKNAEALMVTATLELRGSNPAAMAHYVSVEKIMIKGPIRYLTLALLSSDI
jgi:hypothetical protein